MGNYIAGLIFTQPRMQKTALRGAQLTVDAASVVLMGFLYSAKEVFVNAIHCLIGMAWQLYEARLWMHEKFMELTSYELSDIAVAAAIIFVCTSYTFMVLKKSYEFVRDMFLDLLTLYYARECKEQFDKIPRNVLQDKPGERFTKESRHYETLLVDSSKFLEKSVCQVLVKSEDNYRLKGHAFCTRSGIYTSRHVVEDDELEYFLRRIGTNKMVQVIPEDVEGSLDYEFCRLEPKGWLVNLPALLELKALKFGLTNGQTIGVHTYMDGNYYSQQVNNVLGPDEGNCHIILTRSSTGAGDSGLPVFNAKGEVIAIHYGSDNERKVNIAIVPVPVMVDIIKASALKKSSKGALSSLIGEPVSKDVTTEAVRKLYADRNATEERSQDMYQQWKEKHERGHETDTFKADKPSKGDLKRQKFGGTSSKRLNASVGGVSWGDLEPENKDALDFAKAPGEGRSQIPPSSFQEKHKVENQLVSMEKTSRYLAAFQATRDQRKENPPGESSASTICDLSQTVKEAGVKQERLVKSSPSTQTSLKDVSSCTTRQEEQTSKETGSSSTQKELIQPDASTQVVSKSKRRRLKQKEKLSALQSVVNSEKSTQTQ